MNTNTITAAEFAAEYESGRAGAKTITATLRHFETDHAFLADFATNVARIRNVDSSAKLGDLATALKRATKESEMRLTFSFKKMKATFGMAESFKVQVVPYVAPVKEDSASVLNALENIGRYFDTDTDAEIALAVLTILDRLETQGKATERKNMMRNTLNAIISA